MGVWTDLMSILTLTGVFVIRKYRKLKIANRFATEDGFTLLELIIVVVVLSLLAAIALPIFFNQQRAAIAATVQSDVRNSADALFAQQGYPSQQTFSEHSVTTGSNLVGMVTLSSDPSNPIACVWGAHAINSTDIIAYHFSSDQMRLESGFCGGVVPAIVSTPEVTTSPAPTASPSTSPSSSPSTPPAPVVLSSDQSGVVQQANVNFVPHYYPQNNSLSFCYSVDISASARVAWQYKIDLSKGPFWGADYTTFNSQYNYYVVSDVNNILTVSGTPGGWNEFTGPGQNQSFGFCANNIPTPPLNPAWFTTTVTPNSSNSIWWACLDVATTSTSVYPVPWLTTVDLKQYFKSISGKTPSFVNLTATSQGNNVYTITGSGWNSYVDSHEPRTFSTSICYNPNGSPW